MDGIKLLCDLFANVPDVDAPIGKAGGRIDEMNAIVKSIATNVGLPPDKLIIASVGFEDRPLSSLVKESEASDPSASEVDADAEISRIEGQIRSIMGVDQSDARPTVSEPTAKGSLAEELPGELRMFTGTTEWHRWSILFRKDLLTDGAKYLAEKAGCYWLMDLIASVQTLAKVKRQDLQVWYVAVCTAPPPPKPWRWRPDGTELEECGGTWAWVWCEDGRERVDSVVYTQLVPYTDFPLGRHDGGTLLPPSGRTPADRHQTFKLFACRNELGGITIMLPYEY